MIVITLLLGNWQLNRAAAKVRLQERIEHAQHQAPIHVGAAPLDPAVVIYFPIEAKGTFNSEATVYVDNRVHDRVVGYDIVTPLRVEGSKLQVLVVRGWVPAGVNRNQLPAVPMPTGTVTVQGVALPGDPRVFELSSDVQAQRVWQNVTVERYRKAFGFDLQPVLLQQHNDLGDGLVRVWKRPDAGIDRHRGYALQWFSLSAVIAVLYLVLNVRRAAKEARTA